jgi:RNA polymerase sigma-70 factor, ECF subfamily
MLPDTQPKPTDTELTLRIATGEDPNGAWDILYTRHHSDLRAFLLNSYPPTIADDVGHDAWIHVVNDLRRLPREITNFRGWLFQIARNLALDKLRKKKPEPLTEGVDPPAGDRPALDYLLDKELKHVVAGCLEKLTAKLYEVIVAGTDGETPSEIAERLRITRDLVDQRKFRALEALKECVKKRLP